MTASITPIGPFESIPTRIPALRHLAEVPEDRERFLAWREQVKEWRRVVQTLAERDPKFADYQRDLCAEDGAYCMVMFGHVWEPRGGGVLPFVLHGYQIRLWRVLEAVLAAEGRLGDLVIEKARDMGATTVCVSFAWWGWNFLDPFSAGLVSRNEGLVDMGPGKGTDSMFAKMDFLRLRMPPWMAPPGFDENNHRQHLMLLHPNNPNSIIGEATTSNAGRSYRNTMRFNDESAFFPDLDEAAAAQAPTTQHRVFLSSVSLDRGRAFHDMARLAESGDGASFVRLHWHLHPDHTPERFEEARERMASMPEKFAREYEMDYFAGAGNAVYPFARNKSVGDFPYQPGMPIACSIDPGHRDPTAVSWIQTDPRTGRHRVVRAYQRAGLPASFWASILTGYWEGGAEAFPFEDEEYDLMLWTRELGRVTYVGDPAINAKEAATATSFNEQLRRSSALLYRANGRGGQIYVQTTRKEGRGNHPERIRALRELLPFVDFHDDPRVADCLRAVQEYHFPVLSPSRQATREALIPVHDGSSHYASTLEYWAVNRTERPRLGEAPGVREAPIIADAGGRPLGHRDRPAR